MATKKKPKDAKRKFCVEVDLVVSRSFTVDAATERDARDFVDGMSMADLCERLDIEPSDVEIEDVYEVES
jgi:hypothetical protein